jgi:redox-sensing transcriptional repressor
VVALFDNDTSKIGERTRNGIEVFDVKQIAKVVQEKGIDVAVIAVPARIAQKVLNQLCGGREGDFEFAPAPLISRLGVKVKTVDLTTSLESLSYFLAQPAPCT